MLSNQAHYFQNPKRLTSSLVWYFASKAYITDVDYTSQSNSCHPLKQILNLVYNSHMQDGSQQNEPGQVIRPGETTQTIAELPQPIPVAESYTEAPAQAVAAVETPIEQPQQEPIQPFQTPDSPDYNQDYNDQEPQPLNNQIEWTASEYIANPKGMSWFVILAAGSIVLAIIVYFVSRDIVPTVVIATLGIIVGIFAARQPQTLPYRIDNQGIHIGQKFYPYSSFKAFSVAQEHAIGFIQLLPLKRFMPPLVIHYAPEDQDNIADVLSAYLPYEEYKADPVDNLTRRLRF